MMKKEHRQNWTVQLAIKKRVAFEDTLEWAKRPQEPFKIVPPMPPSLPWKPASLHALLSKVLP